MAFTEDEAAYLKPQLLARIATVGPDGLQPARSRLSVEERVCGARVARITGIR